MRVSENGRYLVQDNGEPFFFLADTAWSLFYRPTLAEAGEYLRNRQAKGFTTIMPVVLRENIAREGGNVYGDLPLHDNDPARPNEAFFRHVDSVIELAVELGLVMALLPTWGEQVGPLWMGDEKPEGFDPARFGPILFNEENARTYGRFLGERYRDQPVIWVVGGDRNPVNEQYAAVWTAMAEGLRDGDGGRGLITYHPCRPSSSSRWFHDAPWLDFNMMQTSTVWDFPNYQSILDDYNRLPIKPTVDGEPRYEDSYERFHTGKPSYGRRISDHQVRKAAYNAMLSGAMGHTYGCRDVWYFYDPEREPEPARDVKTYWKQAMDFPGAYQMGFMKRLLQDHPWHLLEPDQERRLVVYGQEVRAPFAPAAISRQRDFALVYYPEPMPLWIDLGALVAGPVVIRWFDPRTNQYVWAGKYDNNQVLRLEMPAALEPDCALVLVAQEGRTP